jgi:ADP-ribose pyrophosphatase YjhB (NUDIX family)
MTVAYVTGAARGVGQADAFCLAADGHVMSESPRSPARGSDPDSRELSALARPVNATMPEIGVATAVLAVPTTVSSSRRVVAVVVEWRGRIALLRRSDTVDHDCGRWHCVTGYIEDGVSPEQQALDELYEETALGLADLDALEAGNVLLLPDDRGRLWQVHTFRAVTRQRRLTLDGEHNAHRWVRPADVARFGNRVAWLDDVLAATRAS